MEYRSLGKGARRTLPRASKTRSEFRGFDPNLSVLHIDRQGKEADAFARATHAHPAGRIEHGAMVLTDKVQSIPGEEPVVVIVERQGKVPADILVRDQPPAKP